MRVFRYFSLIILPSAAMVLLAMVNGPSSSGAPASHTGAPGEQTCATAGCHDDNGINTGTAKLTLDAGGITNYVPGKTYTIKVRIEDPDKVRFGFQILALSANSNENIGKFKITDAVRTQFMPNFHALQDREYVTYTFAGTDAVSPGVGEWSVNWKAPETAMGPVVFYAAAVSANDNENDKGDFSYTQSLLLKDNQ
jgi:hypothetical protein